MKVTTFDWTPTAFKYKAPFVRCSEIESLTWSAMWVKERDWMKNIAWDLFRGRHLCAECYEGRRERRESGEALNYGTAGSSADDWWATAWLGLATLHTIIHILYPYNPSLLQYQIRQRKTRPIFNDHRAQLRMKNVFIGILPPNKK